MIIMSYRVKRLGCDSRTSVRNVSTGRRVRRLRVSHYRKEQTQTDHIVLFGRVTHPVIDMQLRVFHAQHEEESYLRPLMEYRM